ncbi:TIGR02206 family membrane protein [Mesobacillus subterraneus]|uniref:TIGR02206 family membrane protein n=1 Tax=Mesobacillus subterraneus TaxID=285983 RepID=A0A427TRA2_9BACI|nr:TIGR02206 family membrane protein [Mesobacillus subterraneus]RSD26882.1 TIGR02206 family membrane protein [Mesobacillus subterraneus]
MFSVTGMQGFVLFSPSHLFTLGLFFAVCLALVLFRERLMPYKNILKWSIFWTLVVCEVSAQSWLILTGQWEIGDLPLHLCSMSSFLAIYIFLKKSVKGFYVLYFIGTLPAILAMVTPEMSYVFPHFHYIEYFLHHSAIPIAALYFILFEGYRVPRKAILFTFLVVNLAAVPIFFFNLLFDTNYFYLASPTESKTILSFFGSGILYYLNLEAAALIVFSITYAPMWQLIKMENRRKLKAIYK